MNETVKDARNVIEHLSCAIGERHSGSPNENLAFDYLAKLLEEMGYSTTRHKFSIAPSSRYFILYMFAGAIMIAAGLCLRSVPWFAVILPLFIFSVPQITRLRLNIKQKTETSQNLIAALNNENSITQSASSHKSDHEGVVQETNNRKKLILCAHVDSAKANAITNKNLLRIYGQSMFWAQRIAFLLSAMGLLVLFELRIPPVLLPLMQVLGIGVGVLWIFLEVLSQNKLRYSPGVYDNAAAVGVLVALAKYYQMNPQPEIELVFLFTGAEENGMIGAGEFVKTISRDDSGRTSVLNLDLIGAGEQLQYVERDGTLFQKTTDRWMNDIIRQIDETAGNIWYTKQSGDYLPFLQNGICATSIQTGGNSEAQFSYHTLYDRIELIEDTSLAKVIKFTIQFITLFAGKHRKIDG